MPPGPVIPPGPVMPPGRLPPWFGRLPPEMLFPPKPGAGLVVGCPPFNPGIPGFGAGRVDPPPGNCGREIPPNVGPPPGAGRVTGRSVPVMFPNPPGAGRVGGCMVLGSLMFGRLPGFEPLNPGEGRVAPTLPKFPAPMFPVLGKFGF